MCPEIRPKASWSNAHTVSAGSVPCKGPVPLLQAPAESLGSYTISMVEPRQRQCQMTNTQHCQSRERAQHLTSISSTSGTLPLRSFLTTSSHTYPQCLQSQPLWPVGTHLLLQVKRPPSVVWQPSSVLVSTSGYDCQVVAMTATITQSSFEHAPLVFHVPTTPEVSFRHFKTILYLNLLVAVASSWLAQKCNPSNNPSLGLRLDNPFLPVNPIRFHPHVKIVP